MNYKNFIYSITCLSFSVIIGAAVYEHLAVVPNWSSAPPKSLAMFQGEYGLDPAPFWKLIHPLTLLLFFLTLIISWKTARRWNLLVVFLGYVVILVTTSMYFVPELIEITTTTYSEHINNELTQRAKSWEILSLIRLLILMGLSIILFLGLTKTDILHKKIVRGEPLPASPRGRGNLEG